MPRFLHSLVVAAVLLCGGLSQAQPSRTPAVGTILPTVSAFDENGEPFSTDSLRGHYTVLVFGCLT